MRIGEIIETGYARLNRLESVLEPGFQEEDRPVADAVQGAAEVDLPEWSMSRSTQDSADADRITTR